MPRKFALVTDPDGVLVPLIEGDSRPLPATNVPCPLLSIRLVGKSPNTLVAKSGCVWSTPESFISTRTFDPYKFK